MNAKEVMPMRTTLEELKHPHDEILKSLARGTKPVTPLLAKTAQQRQHLNHLIKQIAYPVE